VRRAACALALAVPILLPAQAHGKNLCGSASVAQGAAPLTVTFTSTCGAAHWDFGDGQSADGETVQHTYAAGAWTVYAGAEKVGVITARGVDLRMPPLVGYKHRLTFRGAVVPPAANEQVLVLAAGRLLASVHTRTDGSFRLTRRIRLPGPYTARWIDAESTSVATTVRPRIVARIVGGATVGQPLTVVARVVPTAAGSVRIQVWRGRRLVADAHSRRVRLNTRAATRYRIRVTSVPAPGFAGRTTNLTTAVALPHLRRG
jgi:hypothetical protein